MWYVKAAGGVWGPYPEARLHAFAAEGRINGQTPVSPWADGPFAAASANAEFAGIVSTAAGQPRARAAQPMQTDQPLAAAAPAHPSAAPQPAESGPLRSVLVWARVTATSAPAFQVALEACGQGVPLQPGLWLVQARAGASGLRNRLSRTLGPADALLVVEAPLEQAAWFNLDPVRDREVRRLWSASGAA